MVTVWVSVGNGDSVGLLVMVTVWVSVGSGDSVGLCW